MNRTCTHCQKQITRKVHPRTVNPFCGSSCYGAWQIGKDFQAQGKPKRERKRCNVSGCSNDHFGKGFCRTHYLSVHYSPPKQPTKYTRKSPVACANCGKQFIARHKSPKYCSMKCSSSHQKKPFILKKGYRKLLIPSHPRSDGKGYVFEHIVVAEAAIGRSLFPGEEVHHIDHNKQNNDPSNLLVCANHEEHMKFHARP